MLCGLSSSCGRWGLDFSGRSVGFSLQQLLLRQTLGSQQPQPAASVVAVPGLQGACSIAGALGLSRPSAHGIIPGQVAKHDCCAGSGFFTTGPPGKAGIES